MSTAVNRAARSAFLVALVATAALPARALESAPDPRAAGSHHQCSTPEVRIDQEAAGLAALHPAAPDLTGSVTDDTRITRATLAVGPVAVGQPPREQSLQLTCTNGDTECTWRAAVASMLGAPGVYEATVSAQNVCFGQGARDVVLLVV